MAAKMLLPFTLFFLSGFTGLVYQVLWMKELKILFGSTTYATSTTLCAFFLGLSVGSYFFGKRVDRYASSLRVYGILELAVAASALLYFVLLNLYFAFYPPLFQLLAEYPVFFVGTKFVLSILILFPPAFFMGGTLPILSQHIVKERSLSTQHVAYLYATNTFGAAAGVLSAGFFLPRLLGFSGTYSLAVALTVVVGLVAVLFGSRSSLGDLEAQSQEAAKLTIPEQETRVGADIRGLAMLSGFLSLALQVLWTTMFAQTLQNSVYTFSLIVLCFLIALACGSLIAGVLAQRNVPGEVVLSAVLLLSAVLVGLTPFVFQFVTDGMGKVGDRSGFGEYLSIASASIVAVLFLPTLTMGIVFPYLLKFSEKVSASVGFSVGNITAWNTAGAICGALVAGFITLPLLGLWPSIRLVATLFAMGALFVCTLYQLRRSGIACMAVILLLVSVLDPSRLPLVKTYPLKKKDSLLEVWEGTDAVVAVIRRNRSLRIKVNNFYVLGSSGARKREEMQTHVAFMIHPQPKKVFYLGLGTGITAGAALKHPVESVKVAELLPEVVKASEKYFKPYLNNLFGSEKAQVLIEDGRNYFRGTNEKFDVVVGDLFLPWKAGTGGLYSKDHFQVVHQRLESGGIYAQWIPLYQISKEEFGIIANTMLQVFPRVTLWRRDFLTDTPVVALVGHADDTPLDWNAIMARSSREQGDVARKDRGSTFLAHYCGSLSQTQELVASYPVNTDEFPVIEYLSPQTHRNRYKQHGRNAASWFTGKSLAEFYKSMFELAPPEKDSFLVRVPLRERGMVLKGYDVYRNELAKGSAQTKRVS